MPLIKNDAYSALSQKRCNIVRGHKKTMQYSARSQKNDAI
jgi:hypothetical protein